MTVEKKKRPRLTLEEKAARAELRLEKKRQERKAIRDTAWLDVQGRMRKLEAQAAAACANATHKFARAAHAAAASLDIEIRKLRRAYRTAMDTPPTIPRENIKQAEAFT